MKRNSCNLKSALIVAVGLALMCPFGLCYAKKKTPPPENKPHITAYWAIASVDAASSTISIVKSNASTNLTLHITSATKLKADGKPAKLADLQNGMKVNFSVSGGMCSSLDAVAPPAPPENKKKGKKNK